MAEQSDISIEALRVLVERAGMRMSDEELEEFKPMYDHHRRQSARLYEIDLDAEDMALVFPPVWEPG